MCSIPTFANHMGLRGVIRGSLYKLQICFTLGKFYQETPLERDYAKMGEGAARKTGKRYSVYEVKLEGKRKEGRRAAEKEVVMTVS